jgi:hypothetical protein
MNNTPYHGGKYYASTSLDWMPTDTKENFEKLMQDPLHRKYFQDCGWDQPGAITYQLNSEGFRCDDFDNTPCVVALGCSYTVGIGLPITDIWPTLVGQALGLKVVNLAWGGNAIDTCFRMADYWLPKLNPKLVCMLTPPKERIEIVLTEKDEFFKDQHKSDVFMPHSMSKHYRAEDHFLNMWFMQDQNQLINKKKNTLAIKQLCTDLGVEFLDVDTQTTMTRSREDIGYARDYMHGGPKIHCEIADMFLKKYEQNQINLSSQ